jgi:predicted  nucleic acid-binding Zn-ribbon protein
MNPVLEKLLVLQDRDMRLRQLQHDLGQLPKEEKAIQDKLARESQNLEALKQAAKKLESDRKQLELEVKSKQELIARYKKQQMETRKNEEYQALTHEIERAEKDISGIEDKELELMESYEQALKNIKEEDARVQKYRDEAAERLKYLNGKKENFTKEAEAVKAEVGALEPAMDPAALARYRRILQSKGDKAIVPIEHGKVCGGCHMALTQQTVVAAKADQNLVACDDCGRLIFWTLE